MLTVDLFKCGICGETSNNRNEIEKHDKIGYRTPRYAIRTKVHFQQGFPTGDHHVHYKEFDGVITTLILTDQLLEEGQTPTDQEHQYPVFHYRINVGGTHYFSVSERDVLKVIRPSTVGSGYSLNKKVSSWEEFILELRKNVYWSVFEISADGGGNDFAGLVGDVNPEGRRR